MRLEVLVGLEDPVIFPLDKSRIILGSGEGCDIIIEADGISRRHILITTEDDLYYVTDQGSTNGSFVNEEKLQPGKRVELTSFFPVRLGTETLLSLLSDEEAFEASNPRMISHIEKDTSYDESTRVISVKDLKRAKTDDLIKKRDQVRADKKKAPKKKKTESRGTMWFGIFIIFGSVLFTLLNRPTSLVVPPTEVVEAPPKVEEIKPPVESQLIDENLLPGRDFVQELLNRGKCTIDTEIYLCQHFNPGSYPFGAITIGLTNYVLVDATAFYKKSAELLTEKNATPEALADVTAYLYLLLRVQKLDLNKLEESNVIIGLFKKTGEGTDVLENVIAFKPKIFNEKRASIVAAPLKVRSSSIHKYINFTKSFYRVY